MLAVKYYAKLSNQKEIVMSRAGKYPVEIKNGVSVELTDNAVVVKGPKGELHVSLDTKHANLVDIKVEDGHVVVTPKNAEDKASRAMWGTMTRNIKSAVQGVSEGFAKPSDTPFTAALMLRVIVPHIAREALSSAFLGVTTT